MRRRVRRVVLAMVAAALVLAVVAFVHAFRQSGSSPVAGSTPSVAGPAFSNSLAPTSSADSPSASPSGTSTVAANQVVSTLQKYFTSTTPEPSGTNFEIDYPNHVVTMTVSSDDRPFVVGYLVPTGKPETWSATKVAMPWSATVKAYGNGYLAGIFVQAGADATTTTCTITIDGRVHDTKTVTGAYDRMICIA